MGWQIIKQTKVEGENFTMVCDDSQQAAVCIDGLFAIWSTVVDDFIYFNLTRDEVVAVFVERERERVETELKNKMDRIEAGEPTYYQFTMSFEAAVGLKKEVHGL